MNGQLIKSVTSESINPIKEQKQKQKNVAPHKTTPFFLIENKQKEFKRDTEPTT